MTIAEYETLTGINVPSSSEAFVLAQLNKSQRILESMLGFTLDPTKVNTNQYTEIGKTQSDCPCPSDSLVLDAPDAIINAYRLFSYNSKDQFLSIDPATAIHKVKLVKDGVTYLTLDADEYRGEYKNGLIKYLEQIRCWCNCQCLCKYVQLAVDADWVWPTGSNIPSDLLDILAEMGTYYSDNKNNIKSETLGSHSYTKFDNDKPEYTTENLAIIKKYAGPNGSVYRTITI